MILSSFYRYCYVSILTLAVVNVINAFVATTTVTQRHLLSPPSLVFRHRRSNVGIKTQQRPNDAVISKTSTWDLFMKQPSESSPSNRPKSDGFSYVEDGVYTNLEEEVDAMGGDPFFLLDSKDGDDSNSVDTLIPAPIQMPIVATTIIEPIETMTTAIDKTTATTETWEWDGVVLEDAYFDEE
jgi:hypothetical protein